MSQTTYNTNYALGREGQIADTTNRQVDSFLAEGAIKYGLVVQQGTADDQVKAMAALAADPDAIVATLASSASPQTISGAGLDGAVGGNLISPAQSVTITLSNHADWDATTAVVYGLDADGNPISENLAIPNGGNATVTGLLSFSRVTSVYIPAQSGTGGTATVGTGATAVVLTRDKYLGVAVYDPMTEPYLSTSEVEDDEQLGVMVKGRVCVVTEAIVTKGAPCYVRTTESGGDVRGQVRGSPASGFALLQGAKFVTSAAADAIAVLELS